MGLVGYKKHMIPMSCGSKIHPKRSITRMVYWSKRPSPHASLPRLVFAPHLLNAVLDDIRHLTTTRFQRIFPKILSIQYVFLVQNVLFTLDWWPENDRNKIAVIWSCCPMCLQTHTVLCIILYNYVYIYIYIIWSKTTIYLLSHVKSSPIFSDNLYQHVP